MRNTWMVLLLPITVIFIILVWYDGRIGGTEITNAGQRASLVRLRTDVQTNTLAVESLRSMVPLTRDFQSMSDFRHTFFMTRDEVGAMRERHERAEPYRQMLIAYHEGYVGLLDDSRTIVEIAGDLQRAALALPPRWAVRVEGMLDATYSAYEFESQLMADYFRALEK